MKHIRLLLHETCNRFCEHCCNQKPQHDLDALRAITYLDVRRAETITITGGEPMLDPLKVQTCIRGFRRVNGNVKLYMYTAKTRPAPHLIACMEYLDGLTVTLHEPRDVRNLWTFQQWLDFRPHWGETMSLRLNYFPEEGVELDDMQRQVLENFGWQVNPIEWLEDCPLPENEIFLRARPVTTARERNYRKRYREKAYERERIRLLHVD